MGTSIRRNPEARYIAHEAILQRAWQLYAQNSLNIPRFLACACHFLQAFDNNLLIRTANEVDFFVTAPIHDIGKYVTGVLTVYEALSVKWTTF